MAQMVMAPAARVTVSQVTSGRHGARSARSPSLVVRSASGASMGGQRFQRGPDNRRGRGRAGACRPQGFCGPQFGMGPGGMGFGMGVSPTDLNNMMKVRSPVSPVDSILSASACLACVPSLPATLAEDMRLGVRGALGRGCGSAVMRCPVCCTKKLPIASSSSGHNLLDTNMNAIRMRLSCCVCAQDFEKWMGASASGASGAPMFVPVDILQDADMYTFTTDLPGVSKADTKVQLMRGHAGTAVHEHRFAVLYGMCCLCLTDTEEQLRPHFLTRLSCCCRCRPTRMTGCLPSAAAARRRSCRRTSSSAAAAPSAASASSSALLR